MHSFYRAERRLSSEQLGELGKLGVKIHQVGQLVVGGLWEYFFISPEKNQEECFRFLKECRLTLLVSGEQARQRAERLNVLGWTERRGLDYAL